MMSSDSRHSKMDIYMGDHDVKPEIKSLQRQFTAGYRKTMRSTAPPRVTKADLISRNMQLLESMQAAMPNLLKTIDDNRQKLSSIKGNELCPLPTDNVFLRKYDPIRLLGRLRASLPSTSAVSKPSLTPIGKPKKALICEAAPSKALQVSRHAEIDGGMALGHDKAVICRKRQSAGVVMRTRKYSMPKHSRSYHRRILWNKCTKKSISDERMRILAAVNLKRGLANARSQKEQDRRKTVTNAKRRVGHLLPKKEPFQTFGLINGNGNGMNGKYEDIRECETGCEDLHVRRTALPRPLPRQVDQFTGIDNPTIMHTIFLLRHKRELQDRLETVDSEGIIYKLGPTPEKGDSSEEKPGYLYGNVKLKSREVKHILSERILVSLAHAGFTHSKLRPLEVLTDFVGDFLASMAQRLKAVTEMEMIGVDHGFPDPMERVLTEKGLGGVRGLEEFFRSNVPEYERRMEEQCQTFRRQYAYKVRSMVGLTNTTTSSTDGTGTNGVTGNCSRTVTISTSNAGSNSTTITPSIPLSPGNSVLAEILSNQEQNQNKTLQTCPQASSNGMEKQSMGVPPPNVVIRPNMIFNNTPQHTQMVLQTLNSIQSPPVKTLQPHLTQLLQRPVSTTHLAMRKNPNYTHQQTSHISQSSQYQGMMQSSPVQVASPATPSPSSFQEQHLGPNDLNQLLINVNASKTTASSTISMAERQTSHLSEASFKNNKGKTLTLVRSASNTSSGIVINSERQLLQTTRHPSSNLITNANSPIDMYSDLTTKIHGSPTVTHHHQRQSNNVISINLSGITNIDLNNSAAASAMQDETVTMHVAEAVSQTNFSPVVKFKDPASGHRNLLRLNFEQAPNSGGDSTVLLSSSPANQSETTDTNFIPVQFF